MMNFIAKNKRISKIFPKWSERIKWKSALEESRHAAHEGYKIAMDNLKRVKEDIDKVSEELKQGTSDQVLFFRVLPFGLFFLRIEWVTTG